LVVSYGIIASKQNFIASMNSEYQWLPITSLRLNQYIVRSLLGVQDATGLRLNYHIGVLIGCTSLLWSGHLIHVAIPVSRGSAVTAACLFNAQPHPEGLAPLFHLQWQHFSSGATPMNEFGSSINSGQAILTLNLGLNGTTDSLWLTDISHHHLAISVICLVVAHLYSSVKKGFIQSRKDLATQQPIALYHMAIQNN
jgi:hypothetical protein